MTEISGSRRQEPAPTVEGGGTFGARCQGSVSRQEWSNENHEQETEAVGVEEMADFGGRVGILSDEVCG